MQQKNQASMSEEEKEGEVIERRNTEEGLFFFPSHSFFSSPPPIQPCDVISCQVFVSRAPRRASEEAGVGAFAKCPAPCSS